MNTHVVIMAGGVGSRLWPVSTPEKPKQFIDLLGIGKTLIQMTLERFSPVCELSNFWVVTSEAYVDIVREQLPQIPKSHILAEPEPRNTAPCIAYACWKIHAESPDANIIVTPADALVINVQKFAAAIRKALNFTEGTNNIVTVGDLLKVGRVNFGKYANIGPLCLIDIDIALVNLYAITAW